MDFKGFVVLFIVFTVGNLIFSLVSQEKYHISLHILRKSLYTVFVIGIGIGIIQMKITVEEWDFLLMMTGGVIFMDLALLLTPSITKIWSTEFKHSDYMENIISKNKRLNLGTSKRVETMSVMLQNAGDYFSQFMILPEEEHPTLESYLSEYASLYGFTIHIEWIDAQYPPKDPNYDETEVDEEGGDQDAIAFLAMLQGVLGRVEHMYSLEFKKKEELVNALNKTLIVSQIEDDTMIAPVYMEERSLLVVLRNQKGDFLEIDAVHITNLVYLYYSYN